MPLDIRSLCQTRLVETPLTVYLWQVRACRLEMAVLVAFESIKGWNAADVISAECRYFCESSGRFAKGRRSISTIACSVIARAAVTLAVTRPSTSPRPQSTVECVTIDADVPSHPSLVLPLNHFLLFPGQLFHFHAHPQNMAGHLYGCP